ncbi:MAG TPA: hypothetical protein VGX25_09450 [Actinophytocola sp.]|uniref:hypothetical protein n=1 Tax=Actinophytocola sp. TaxID=1872138 RepID=UPI002DDD7968|nr:hypothetical protein [Actinophytocola sp.]HEV2779613.1 hypothetical protein [Actinophytocola sp.]
MIKSYRRSPRASLLLAGIAVLATAGLAGCSTGNGDEGVVSAGGTTTSTQAADREMRIKQYRDCLTQHGIPLLDQPTEEGLPQIDKNRVPADRVSVALQECRESLPTGGDVDKPAQEDIEARQRYAACIREHGVPAYPDPDPQSGEQRMSDELSRQLKNDPKLPAAEQACQSVLPSGKGTVGG